MQALYVWEREMEHTYTLCAHIACFMHRIMPMDPLPRRQAAAIFMRLTGPARELTRSIAGEEIMKGQVCEGVFHDPVSYIIAGLCGRLGQRDEETRLAAMTEMLAFF